MNKTLIKYRTKDQQGMCTLIRTNQYAVVPTSWLSDLLDWLLSEEATIVSTTHNEDNGLILPTEWPHYRACLDYAKVSDVLESVIR
jgi:hypothetical protein